MEADNTSRENKNQTVLRYLAMLCRKLGFQVASMLNLRVGHTHNILGQPLGHKFCPA